MVNPGVSKGDVGIKRVFPRRIRMGREGQSAVFDAFIFFIILISASMFIYIIPNNLIIHNENLLSSQYRHEYVDDTLRAVLRSTIDPTSYVMDGKIHEVSEIDVQRAIQLYMELRFETDHGSTLYELTELRTSIGAAFESAIPSEYEFSVDVTFTKGIYTISELVVGEDTHKTTKYSASFVSALSGSALTIILSIWS